MYSCTSFGTKLGGGIGTALTGWLLAASGFNGEVVTQSASCLNILHFMYLWFPVILALNYHVHHDKNECRKSK